MGGDGLEYCLHCGSEIPDGLDHCALGCEGTSVGIDTTGPGDVLFNRFEVLREIGRSGSGTVYRVRPLSGGVDLALKLYHSHLSGSPRARARLMEVMSGASLIQHEHLVRILSDHAYGDRLGITMELVAGRSLADHVEGQVEGSPLITVDDLGRLDVRVRLIGELASVLDHLHSCGLAHGNIDPANLMLAEATDGLPLRIKMTDPSIGLGSGRGWWQVEQRCPAAPELSDQRQIPTAASDVYSFGQVVLLLLAGATVADPEEIPAQVQQRLPGDLRDAVLGCLRGASARPRKVSPIAALARQSVDTLVLRLRDPLPAAPPVVEPTVVPDEPSPDEPSVDGSSDADAGPSSSVLTAHEWYETTEQLPVTAPTGDRRAPQTTHKSVAEVADNVVTWALIGVAVAFNLVFIPVAMAADCLTGYIGCVAFGTPAVCLFAFAVGRLSRGSRPRSALHWSLVVVLAYAAGTWGAAYLGYDYYLTTHTDGELQGRSCVGLPFVYPAVAASFLAAAVAWGARRLGAKS